ncbi:tetraspanin-8-like isoform X1 [Nelusetta ayraudi]|uniref:tetraspanin-8-like isoform X1 n=1 Tax=Nelusetta ayraudi TaxID=303726 RepID=UPI003F72392E
MGKVNVCLMRIYKIVSSAVAITSFLMLAFSLFSHGYLHDHEEMESMARTLHIMYFVSITTLLFGILGLFGAIKGKQWALIMSAAGMIIISLFMTACEIPALIFRPQMVKSIELHYQDMLPLPHASEDLLDELMEVQMNFQCCGLDQGFADWGYNISESCVCSLESTKPCVAAPRNSSLFEYVMDEQPIMIYTEPCLPHLVQRDMTLLNSVLAVVLLIIVLWVLYISLCILILTQMNKTVDVPVVMYSQEAKAGNYATLSELT